MTVPIVTIASFDNELGANLAMARLVEAGLHASLIDQELATSILNGMANGRVGLQVHATDAKQARALLPQNAPDTSAAFIQSPARRAFNVAVLGLVMQPLALYSIWLLWSLRRRYGEFEPADRQLVRWAAIVNLATIAVVAGLVIASYFHWLRF